MQVMELIAELEEELSVRPGLFSKKIDLERCGQIIDEIKNNLPKSFDRANYILDNKQKILDNADVVAKNTIHAAEERAAQLTQSTEVIRLAQLEANKLMDKAAASCDMLVSQTKEHLDKMFLETEQFLLGTLSMIRNNREELRNAFIFKRQ